jgi:hypothetical protein
MQIKTSELRDAALDWAVGFAQCMEATGGKPIQARDLMAAAVRNGIASYSTDWSQAGPIIERESIDIQKGNPLYFPKGNEHGDYYEPLWIAGGKHGRTPLEAAMRCYVARKLGNEVDVPDELLTLDGDDDEKANG